MGGPVAFTGTWLALGAGHPGYSHLHGSLSVLAAHGAPAAWVMVVAFLVQAAATAAAGVCLRRVVPGAAGLLLLDAAASVVVALARISCGPGDAAWCQVGADPPSEVVHVTAASVALVSLSLAPVAYGRYRRQTASVVLGVGMLLLLGVFVVAASAGWAEKAAVTLGLGWSAVVAGRTGRDRPPARLSPGPGWPR